MENGKLLVLFQPAELVIIFGAACGTVLIGNPPPVVVEMLKGIGGVFAPSQYKKAFHLENLYVKGRNQAPLDGGHHSGVGPPVQAASPLSSGLQSAPDSALAGRTAGPTAYHRVVE
jgi:hypothetical protein